MTEPSGPSPAPTAGAAGAILTVRDLRIAFRQDEPATVPNRATGDDPAGEVVHGVSFDATPGRVLALVGESGSGKSVTAMSVLGLLPSTARVSGSVVIDGEQVIGADPERLRALRGGTIGTIFQEPMSALNPVFTIGDQIGEAIWAHHPELPAHQRHQRVLELLQAAGIDQPARIAASYPHEASGGQLQRAMIAMAISNDPAIMIADEPTTALDVTVQAGILDLLRDLTRRLGTAVLLITHDMGVVADIADDVAVMERGRIVETASTRQLFEAPQHPYTRKLLAAVPQLIVREPAPSSAVGQPAARIEDAVVVFRGRGQPTTAVDHVSLRIEPGEFLGLVGESGSGKSTVGRTLSALVPLTAGRVEVDGVDLGSASASALRRARSRLGLVFQDPASSLNPRHTVSRSIGDPLRLHRDWSAWQRRGRVLELLDAVRLERAFADRYPHELSGGQRQRVAIARALGCEPALLIADEPTSALDVSVQDQILDLLRGLQRDLGFACLFISHDLAVVSELTSRVAVMQRGRIVEQGPTDRVLHQPQEPYTKRLLAAVPVPDPVRQAERRAAWERLVSTST